MHSIHINVHIYRKLVNSSTWLRTGLIDGYPYPSPSQSTRPGKSGMDLPECLWISLTNALIFSSLTFVFVSVWMHCRAHGLWFYSRLIRVEAFFLEERRTWKKSKKITIWDFTPVFLLLKNESILHVPWALWFSFSSKAAGLSVWRSI